MWEFSSTFSHMTINEKLVLHFILFYFLFFGFPFYTMIIFIRRKTGNFKLLGHFSGIGLLTSLVDNHIVRPSKLIPSLIIKVLAQIISLRLIIKVEWNED